MFYNCSTLHSLLHVMPKEIHCPPYFASKAENSTGVIFCRTLFMSVSFVTKVQLATSGYWAANCWQAYFKLPSSSHRLSISWRCVWALHFHKYSGLLKFYTDGKNRYFINNIFIPMNWRSARLLYFFDSCTFLLGSVIPFGQVVNVRLLLVRNVTY